MRNTLLFPIFLTVSLASGKTISNLNKWLQPFSVECQLHIINYNYTDFQAFPFPVSFQDIVADGFVEYDKSEEDEDEEEEEPVIAYDNSLVDEPEVILGPLVSCIAFVFLVTKYDEELHSQGFAIPSSLVYF